jgi:hypothetical protein
MCSVCVCVVTMMLAGRDLDLTFLFTSSCEQPTEATTPLFRHRTHVGGRVGVVPTPLSVPMARCVSDGALIQREGDSQRSQSEGAGSDSDFLGSFRELSIIASDASSCGDTRTVEASASVRTAVVCGEDGVGKSALARQYCRVGRERRE